MGSLFLLFAGDRLSSAELSAARLDGHVVELGEAYIPADAVETAWLRAGSLRPLVGDLLAASHLSAAWVHGALPDPPARHTVQRAVPRRIHHVIGTRLHYRDPALVAVDLSTIAGVRVTTPARTLADLARTPDAGYRAAAAAWACDDPGLAAAALAWFAAHPEVPHRRTARALLDAAASRAQEEVTR